MELASSAAINEGEPFDRVWPCSSVLVGPDLNSINHLTLFPMALRSRNFIAYILNLISTIHFSDKDGVDSVGPEASFSQSR